jgi:hypothetical protein
MRGPHAQTWLGTIAGPWPTLPWPRRVIVDLPHGDRLVGLENRPQSDGEPSGVVVLLHGLAVDAEVPYVRRAAAQFLSSGYITIRLNFRGAGAGAGLSSKLYHSGVSDDLAAAFEDFSERYQGLPMAVVAYSMSGNTVLKLLGERPQESRKWLRGAVAINPPIDLMSVARNMDLPGQRLYHRCFARLMVRQARINAERYGKPLGEEIAGIRTQREFDTLITCPDWEFEDPTEYYIKASAKSVLARIEVPTLILADEDDPIVPFDQWKDVQCPDCVELVRTKGGGHMGYVADRQMPEGHYRWVDHALTQAVERLSRPPAET